MPDIEQVIVFRHCTRMYANLYRRYAACAAKKLAECARESWRWEENLNWQIQGCNVVASYLDNLHATLGKPLHLDKTEWNVYNFVLVLFLRKGLSCLVAQAAYHANGNASGVGKRFAHGSFANTQPSRTCSLTPPSNRLSFTTRGSRRKPRLSRLWFRLLFCWGSLPVVPPLPRRLQRLAATNCLKFFTA